MAWLQKFILKNKFGFTEQELGRYKKLIAESLNGIENKYISQAKFQLLRNYLDAASWRAVVHNKWITANYFPSESISQPECYGLLHPRYGHTMEDKSLLSANDLEVLVKDIGLKEFVLKHIGGGNGNHVFIIQKVVRSGDDLLFNTIDGKSLQKRDIDALLKNEFGKLQGFLVQEKEEIHPRLCELTAGGMASVRIYTFSLKRGHCKPRASFIRLGLKSGATDHSGYGGVYAPIDFESGSIKKGVSFSESHEWLSHHPVTGKKFEGMIVPDWERLLELAEKVAQRCPGLNWVGWDFAVTPYGPSLLEGNVGDTDVMGTQLLVGGFIESGIFDEWMQDLDLPLGYTNDYNKLDNWKMRYIKSMMRRLIKSKH